MAFKKNVESRKTEMTSLIDMVFLLLVFFLVSVSLGQNIAFVQELLPIAIPKTHVDKAFLHRGEKKIEKAHLVVQVFLDPQGRERFYLLHRCLTPRSLGKMTSRNYAELDPAIWPEVPWVDKRPSDRPNFRYYRGSARQLGQPVKYATLEKRVKALKRLLKDPAIILRAEETLPYEAIAKLLGLCNQQEITKISLTVGTAETLDDFVRD